MNTEAINLVLEALTNLDKVMKRSPDTDKAIKTLEEALKQEHHSCSHRIVDITNEAIKSGYMCMDCGALFKAYIQKEPKQEHNELAATERQVEILTDELANCQRALSRSIWDRQDVEALLFKLTGVKWSPKANTPQRTWVGLQSHEIAELVDEVDWYNFPMDLVRASEAKLKEKNI